MAQEKKSPEQLAKELASGLANAMFGGGEQAPPEVDEIVAANEALLQNKKVRPPPCPSCGFYHGAYTEDR